MPPVAQHAATRGSRAAVSTASQPPALLPQRPTRPSHAGWATTASTSARTASTACASKCTPPNSRVSPCPGASTRAAPRPRALEVARAGLVLLARSADAAQLEHHRGRSGGWDEPAGKWPAAPGHVDSLVRWLAELARAPEGVEHPAVQRALLRIGVRQRDLSEAIASGRKEERLTCAAPLTPLDRTVGACEIAVAQARRRLVPARALVHSQMQLPSVRVNHPVAHEAG